MQRNILAHRTVHRAGRPPLRQLFLLHQLVLVHFAVRDFQQIPDQIIVVAVADLVTHRIADGVLRLLVVLVDDLLQPGAHLLQLLHRGVFLNNHEFVATVPRQKTVRRQNPGEKRRKRPDKPVALIMAVVVVHQLQIVHVKHQHAYVQRTAPLLDLVNLLFQRFLIADARHVH